MFFLKRYFPGSDGKPEIVKIIRRPRHCSKSKRWELVEQLKIKYKV